VLAPLVEVPVLVKACGVGENLSNLAKATRFDTLEIRFSPLSHLEKSSLAKPRIPHTP
jgi:hypothetical protein